MNEFVWQDHYLLGNQNIDQQHKQLFELANKMVACSNNNDLTHHAMLLYKHVRQHFREEESFMKSHGYPDYQIHVDTHNLMLSKLVAVSEKIKHGEWQQQQVLEFMREWINHILDEDAAINDYFRTTR